MGGRVSALIETFEKGFDMNFAAYATKQKKDTNVLHNNVLLPLLVVPQSLEIKSDLKNPPNKSFTFPYIHR